MAICFCHNWLQDNWADGPMGHFSNCWVFQNNGPSEKQLGNKHQNLTKPAKTPLKFQNEKTESLLCYNGVAIGSRESAVVAETKALHCTIHPLLSIGFEYFDKFMFIF